jgi:hypothetical protein
LKFRKKKNSRGSFDWRLPFLGWHSIRSERSANQVEEDAEERSTNQVEEDAEEGGGERNFVLISCNARKMSYIFLTLTLLVECLNFH